jgi:hypothetical protein
MASKMLAWWPQPMAGDVLWCHFPHLPQLDPGPKPRPGLVMQVRELSPQKYRVLIAYGTSQKTRQLRSGEFAVSPQDGAAYSLMGLQAETKFSLQQSVELDYNETWFKPPPHQPHGLSPKLGMLHPSLMPRVAAAWRAVSAP